MCVCVSRHISINFIILRACASVNAAAILEQSGLMFDDGKRPDGMTLIMEYGTALDLRRFLCQFNILVPIYLPYTLLAGSAATSVESFRRYKYVHINIGLHKLN